MNGEQSRKEATDSVRSSGSSDKDEEELPRTCEDSPWIEEVIAIIADISSCVSQASLSDTLTSRDPTAACAYINIETLETRRICVKVSASGFTVVGNNFDDNSLSPPEEDGEDEVFETPYSLLQAMSPSYVEKFSAELCERLKDLSDQVS